MDVLSKAPPNDRRNSAAALVGLRRARWEALSAIK